MSALYVPVHKRVSVSSSSSSGIASPASSLSPSLSTFDSSDSELAEDELALEWGSESRMIYTLNDLLLLAKSPLARLSPETRTSLREFVPEIVTNRKQRQRLQAQSRSMDPTSANRVRHRSPSRATHDAEELSWRRRS